MTGSNPTVWLTLQAHDAPSLIDYYLGTLGFVLAARYGAGRKVDHAQLNWPEGSGGVMLGSHKPGSDCSREPGTAGGYVVTADPTGLYARLRQRKADFARPLHETPYGAKDFTVCDPEGNPWSFGDYRGAARPTTA